MAVPLKIAIPALLAALSAAAGCASGKPPVLSDSGHRSPCPDDLTPACYEYMGKATRCFCSSREGLREILEPTKE